MRKAHPEEFFLKHLTEKPADIYLRGGTTALSWADYYTLATRLGKMFLASCKQKNQTTLYVNIEDSEYLMCAIWACLFTNMDIVLVPGITDTDKMLEILETTDNACLVSDIPALQKQSEHIDFSNLSKSMGGNDSGHVRMEESIKKIKDSPTMFNFFSSGTTGNPKWIPISFGLYEEAITTLHKEGLLAHTENQEVLITSPLFHAYGMICLLEYTYGGSTVILPKERSFIGPVKELLKTTTANKVTAIEGVPHFHHQLGLVLKKTKLTRLRHIGFGGGALNTAVVSNYREHYPGLSYSVRYGMTETPSVISIKLFTPPYDQHDWKSCGKVVSLYQVRIIDSTGQIAKKGEEGEIQISGKCIAKKVVAGRFFATGDMGYLNESEELVITGRISSFIKHNGFRISPELLETTLLRYNAVTDCRVFSDADRLVAELVVSQEVDKEDVISFLAGKIPDYAMPNTFKFVAGIPRTKSGKIKRV